MKERALIVIDVQNEYFEAYSWGLLTRVRRRKGRLALLR